MKLLVLVLLLAVGSGVAQEKRAPRVTTIARTARHPKVAKEMRLKWVNTVVVAKAVTAGTSTKALGRIATKGLLTRRHHGARPQPMPTLLFVYDPSFTHRELGRLEADVFGSEAIVIGCLAYRLFKAPARAHLPAGFYVLDAKDWVSARLALNTRRSDLLKAMGKVHDGFYVRPQKRFLDEVTRALAALEDAADRASVEGNMPAATALAKETKRYRAAAALKRRMPKKQPSPAKSVR